MPPVDTLDGAVVSFLNHVDGVALDLKLSGGSSRGNPIVGFPFHGHGNQQWKLERVTGSHLWPVFMIRNVQFGTCIDLGQGVNGTHVNGWPGGDVTNTHQLWRFINVDTSGHSYIIQNVGSNMVLDLTGGNRTPMTPIQGYSMSTHMNNRNQIWRLLRMD